MSLALSIVDELATALADRGVAVRGALARTPAPAACVAGSTLPPAPDGDGQLLVGRFEIPITSNKGEPFATKMLLAIIRDLYDEAGGATLFEVLGVWRADDGAFCLDVSIGVEVWTRTPERLAAFVARVARDLAQDVIALRFLRPEILWVTPAAGDAE